MREIALDTETTGLEPLEGHRIIEIGCVEIVNRRVTGRDFHTLVQPDRVVDPGAVAIHGISDERLRGQPRFAEIFEGLIDFIAEDRLIIHNAPFDLGFLNHELRLIDPAAAALESRCKILDTLPLARRLHPGQRASLDALCKRYGVDNSARDRHGALLDARLLADVYLAMTSGQVALSLDDERSAEGEAHVPGTSNGRRLQQRPGLKVLQATALERAAHQEYLRNLDAAVGGACLFRRLDSDSGGEVEAGEKERLEEPG
jgi:DNA polymerase-3 subunit epsilon